MTTANRPAAGPPAEPPAPELVAAGFELENADAGVLHRGMNLADIAHLLDLSATGVIQPDAAGRLLALLLETMDIPAADFPYDPANGEPYNSRERYFVSQAGDVAGWLHAGRPRREAVRVAFRLRLRDDLTSLIEASAELAAELARRSREHAGTLMADQTYLQHAQPSTFGHYLLSFAFPVLRGGQRLIQALEWSDASPGGAGCVNGSRLLPDRGHVASLLGFRSVAEHTRDAMWQVDGLFDMVSGAGGLMIPQSKLAEALEIWASQEFDYVTLADGYSRASVLMPQKRNPYALSILRGTAGSLIGRLSGLLAVAKTPSARSDNLIFAYGEVPRALDLALRATRLSTGVVRTLQVNAERMRAALDSGFSQATDLAEYIMQSCAIDYRSRSEEHTSELQSQSNLVCRLLLEKKMPGHEVALGNLQLLALRVAREVDRLEPVEQGPWNALWEVRRRDEQHLRQVERHSQIILRERIVLRRIEYFEQRRRRVALEGDAQFVDLVEQEHRVLGAGLLHPLDDATGHGAHVGTPVAANVGLVARPAQGDAHVRTAHGPRDRFRDRRLSHTRRPDEQQDGPLGFLVLAGALPRLLRRALAQLAHGQELEHLVLHVREPVVVLLEDLRGAFQVERFFRPLVPGQLGHGLEVGTDHLRFHGVTIRALQALELPLDLFLGGLGKLELREPLPQLVTSTTSSSSP